MITPMAIVSKLKAPISIGPVFIVGIAVELWLLLG